MADTIKPHDAGVCLLDKPLGLSSNQAVQQVKRLLTVKKAGHTGSLDPLATGLLPICLGQATRFAQFLLHANKLYQVTAHVGAMTTTADAEGDVIHQYPVPADLSQRLTKVLPQFIGDIEQIPPMYSALKHQGKRLYQWAREGVEVKRTPRSITIHQLELLDCQADHFTLQVHCSSGTYIRTLIEDIAIAMGTGAYVQSLRRLAIGDCSSVTMLTLAQLTEGVAADRAITLMPVDWLVKQWPKIQVSGEQARRLCQGQIMDWFESDVADGWVQIWQQHPALFIGMGRLNQQRLAPKRLLNREE